MHAHAQALLGREAEGLVEPADGKVGGSNLEVDLDAARRAQRGDGVAHEGGADPAPAMPGRDRNRVEPAAVAVVPAIAVPITAPASVAANSIPSSMASFASKTFAGALCGGSSGNTVSQRAITPARSREVQGRMCNGSYLSSAINSRTRVCVPHRAVGNDWYRVLRGRGRFVRACRRGGPGPRSLH